MEKVYLTINGQRVETLAGKTVWEAATQAGFTIPVLCHHPALPPDGACRICVVELEPQGSLETACNFPVQEGLTVQTHSPKVIEARKAVLELLLSNHPLDCMTCEATGKCLLQDLAYEYEVKETRFAGERQQFPIDNTNPFIQVDRNKCILCRRCVRACDLIAANHTLGVRDRGARTMVIADDDVPFGESTCVSCGTCLQVCPTGAIRRDAGYDAVLIDTSKCIACAMCAMVCPFDVITYHALADVAAPRTVEKIFQSVQDIAQITDCSERGRQLAAQMRERLDKIKLRIRGIPPVRAFFITWLDPLLAPAGRDRRPHWRTVWTSENPSYGGHDCDEPERAGGRWVIPGAAAVLLAPSAR